MSQNGEPTPQPRWWQISPQFARSRGLFFIAAAMVGLLGGLIGSEFVWWLELPLHFVPQLLVVMLVGLVGTVWGCIAAGRVSRREVVALAVAVLATGYLVAAVVRWLPAQRELIPPANPDATSRVATTRILSLNVYTKNLEHDKVLEFIRQQDPDIVFLMEVNSEWLEALGPLDQIYPYHHSHPDEAGNFGVGIWTRLPVTSCTLVGLGSIMRQVDVVLEVEGQPIRFLGVHPLPPSSTVYARERNKVYQGIVELLASEPELPAIVAGDFNSTRFAPHFLSMCREARLYDAGHGQMLGRSWPAGGFHFILGMRIDHVLIGAGWRVLDWHIGPDVGSDHYPVVADLELLKR
ncbi:MAG: endonuclease/exonuclease/phosphatase family protein [Gemmataceae bacterium]